ncbi:D-3-phosphoglycerate dehydrogenase [Bradyrhizobium sp. USDA 4461]
MRALFVDANETLGAVAEKLLRSQDLPIDLNHNASIAPEDLPRLLRGIDIMIVDHTALPTAIAARCPSLKHVVFLGTGARSYMNPEELARRGISLHTIKGYGDTAVAECALALMWASAKNFCEMDRGVRNGSWLRREGIQLTGKTLGLIGFGGIAAETARLALGCGMKVIAWNRAPRSHARVEFVPLERLLAESHVLSLHLLLNDETSNFLSRDRIAKMRPGAILINTARGALIDEGAMIEALRSGHIAHAGLDVFIVEPLPAGHPLTTLPNVTLSAHSGFRTPEASENLIAAALDHCRRIFATGL